MNPFHDEAGRLSQSILEINLGLNAFLVPRKLHLPYLFKRCFVFVVVSARDFLIK